MPDYKKKKNNITLLLADFSSLPGYQYDMAYNGKLNRIRAGAEQVLRDELGLIDLPHGMPDFEEIDQRRITAAKK